jgi:eukaryotic-like serine/threonine-protein kinase
MGAVYRARDTRLGRDVALKALPASMAKDPSRLARLRREARILASLSHPHVATLFGLEETDGDTVLVMELVEGQTLHDRLRRPLPMAEALELARQIAEGLEAAHEQGILHRDLKPENVAVTAKGQVKLLDFGLARALVEEQGVDSRSPTNSAPQEESGAIVGTASYMSPEQARGDMVDERSDVWGFGCVLYEMLSRRRAFPGTNWGESVAAVLEREPDWTALPRETSPAVHSLLRRCLRKDEVRRLHDIADARIELEEAIDTGRALPARTDPRSQSPRRWFPAISAGALALAVVALLLGRTARPVAAPPRPLTRFTIPVPAGVAIAPRGGLAVSPDGRLLVFVAQGGGKPRLHLRRLDEWQTRPIPGTEGASGPFFSPDGEWIAFMSDESQLKKMPLRGGTPQVVCDRCQSFAGSWGKDDRIVFANMHQGGLWRVPAAGGTPEKILSPPTGSGDRYLWPEHLPDGKTVLFTIWHEGRARIAALSLETGQQRTLVDPGSRPRYLPSRQIVYTAEGRLLAVSFDMDRLEVQGTPTPVLDGVSSDPLAQEYDVADGGTLLYLSRASGGDRLVWRSRGGATDPLPLERGSYFDPVLSPDGERIAVTLLEGFARNIWIYDVRRKTLSRLTFSGDDIFSLWHPGGRRVVFTSGRSGPYNVYWTAADGSGEPERLTHNANPHRATSWSPDGDVLLFHEYAPGVGRDIWQLPMSGDDRSVRPFLRTPFNEMEGVFSPDGRWVAFMSDESGRWEVYLRAYPGSREKTRVSVEGGWSPVWNPGGHELFYQNATGVLAVSISGGPIPTVGEPRLLFESRSDVPLNRGKNFDVSRDAQRFLVVERTAPSDLSVILGWVDPLRHPVAPITEERR